MTRRFEGKVAVVTGGNSGIGLATAKAFVREGARVAIIGRRDATLKAARQELGPQALAVQADLSRVAAIGDAMDRIRRHYDRIDALFVNAGVGRWVMLDEVTEEYFDEVMATNVKGLFFTVQKALPLFNQGTAVVLNASINAHLGSAGSTVYAASKAAAVSLARTLAAELLPRGVRVNVVSPGPIETPIFDRMGMSPEQTREAKQRIASLVPLRRFGRPEDIAAAVLYLSSAESAYVVGTELIVDGGATGLR